MPKLNYEKFNQRIASKTMDKIYLLSGDKYFLDYFENIIKKLVLNDNKNDFNDIIFEGENINFDDLENAIDTFPLNSTKKCITIKNFEWENQSPEDIEYFIKILSDIPEYCTILIIEYHEINGIKNINKFKKIEKIIIDQGISCKFDTNDIPIEKQLVHWAKEEFHKNLSIENAKIIKEKCKNLDISHVRNELKKICNYEKEATISKKSLEIISDFSEKSKIFDLPKSIFSQNTKKSFEILNSLIKNKEDPVVILSVICSEYVDLLRAKILSQKSSAMEEIMKNFDYKNKEFRIKNACKRCQTFSAETIKKSLEVLLKADIQLKSTNIDKKLILQNLIIELKHIKAPE